MSIITRAPLLLATLLICGSGLFSSAAQAAGNGGIALGATRVIYPKDNAQVSLPINNTDSKAIFLIQAWVEDAEGKKTADFVVTPPLFVIKPQKENTLRIMYTRPDTLPQDRESVFWLNVKAIPSASKETEHKNTLQIAVLSRIKLFVRPKELPMKSVDAPAKLRFHQNGEALTIKNPTPYYITIVQFHDGMTPLPATMVPPMGQSTVKVPDGAKGAITFQTVSDYGADTPKQTAVMD